MAHERDQEARVEPAGEERAQGHVGHEADPDGFRQPVAERLRAVRRRPGARGRTAEAKAPVAGEALAAVFQHQEVTRPQALDAPEERARARDVAELQERRQGLAVDLGRDDPGLDQRLDL